VSAHKFATVSGNSTTISDDALAALNDALRGTLLLPSDSGYEDARKLWNGMIDRRPSAIARCHESADVIEVVRFANEYQLTLAVKGGGHNIAGNAVCDGGLTIDLSPMKSVHVDPANRTARVEPGATLGDFDKKAQDSGLATPLGINSTTGVAGLTLGGGFGWLSRKHGLALDKPMSSLPRASWCRQAKAPTRICFGAFVAEAVISASSPPSNSHFTRLDRTCNQARLSIPLKTPWIF